MKEIWKPVVGYEGLYEVSNLGRVRSNSYRKRYNGKILTNKKHTGGYHYQTLHKNKKRNNFLVHRLVAIAFIENPLSKDQVNHKNGDKQDNRVENLEWCTQKENAQHAIDTGLKKNMPVGEDVGMSKITNIEAKAIKIMLKKGCKQSCIASIFGIARNTVSCINTGVTWNHVTI